MVGIEWKRKQKSGLKQQSLSLQPFTLHQEATKNIHGTSSLVNRTSKCSSSGKSVTVYTVPVAIAAHCPLDTMVILNTFWIVYVKYRNMTTLNSTPMIETRNCYMKNTLQLQSIPQLFNYYNWCCISKLYNQAILNMLSKSWPCYYTYCLIYLLILELVTLRVATVDQNTTFLAITLQEVQLANTISVQ